MSHPIVSLVIEARRARHVRRTRIRHRLEFSALAVAFLVLIGMAVLSP